MGNALDAFLERFRDVADVWYFLTRFIQDPLADFWKTLIEMPVLGAILAFWEETFGRGATL